MNANQVVQPGAAKRQQIGIVRLELDGDGVMPDGQARKAHIAAAGNRKDRFERIQRRIGVEGKSEGKGVFAHEKRIVRQPENRLSKIFLFVS